MDTTELEQAYQSAAARVSRRTDELEQKEAELSSLIGRLVDEPEKGRAALIVKREEIVNMRDVLRDELEELKKRRGIAYLALCRCQVENAQKEVDSLATKGNDLRKQLNTTDKELRIFRNTSGGRAQTDDDARRLIEQEINQVRLITESQINTRKLTKARAILEQALLELEEAQNAKF